MSPRSDSTWNEVERLFHEALETPADERTAFIRDVAADQPDVRDEVLRLLAQHEDDPTFLEWSPVADGRFDVASAPQRSDLAGRSIGRYRVIELIGEGGMGAVWLAEQDRPRRRVALKILRGGHASPGALRRFEDEAEILGRMQHESIARIYEAGAAELDGARLPFFAMEYIDGRPINRAARDGNWSMRQRLHLLARVADAVHYAHQRGVIHRDLKPANILVHDDGAADGNGVAVKVLDFGVARLVDPEGDPRTLMTSESQLIGTLPYMSPEQLAGDPWSIDTRCDVYAIGVLIYEVLTGRRPHDIDGMSLPQAIRTVAGDDPPPIGSIDRGLRGDVETIVAKAMARDKERRYDSAAAVAADIRRFLDREPIAARPPSAMYQLGKFAHRHRTLVGAGGCVVIALALGFAATLRQMDRVNQKADQLASINEFLGGILTLVHDPGRAYDTSLGELLDDAAAEIDTAFAGEPLSEAAVRSTLGDAYLRLSRLDAAAEHYRRSYELRQAELGADHLDTISSLAGLGATRLRQGRTDDAEPMLRRVVERRRRLLGPDHRLTLGASNDLAMTLLDLERKEDAEALLRETLEAQRTSLGENDRDTLVTALNLANLLRNQRRFEEAEPLYRQRVRLFVERYGEDNVDTLAALDNLAVFLKRAERFDEAEPVYRRAVAGYRRALGPEHRSTVVALHNFGTFLHAVGKEDELIATFEEALSGADGAFGPADPLTVAVRRRYAEILKRRERYEQAEAALLTSLDALHETLGETHERTKGAARELAALYEAWGRPEQAAALRGEGDA